ncbi:hypothetical protein A5724_16440 [Mycobacterium sp. ACS1612]|uniref:hypothetical protein n=1 Tax=Mycobacterium sp. ACS1612 TaxID=1834117 RepID=UPI0007FC1351|nr:hypothetical protein [Mycobacterium sp. ACS1612]OBF34954.1 hypothetical protein A5724_16440 [Mycobacterium sp. ACS1612]
MSDVEKNADLKRRLVEAGEARRKALGLYGIQRTEETRAISERIVEAAGKGMIVEWTILPQDPSETVSGRCVVYCGCSCIA